MKNLKTILVTTLASLFAVLTVVNMSLASPKSAGENTFDMLEIMTRAFDEGGACLNLTLPHPYWATNSIINHVVVQDRRVVTVDGRAGWKIADNLINVEYSYEGPEVSGSLSNCIDSPENYCCQLDTGWFPNEEQ